ncbi:phage tail tape measure protein [Streptomyces mexicanus]|uniref:phage tail tape measure protein n=1 Tax=Streptomyces mexicanus TaxID=178566 RepID=UPI0036659B2A
MANWNLSVELRGSGNDLAQSLRQAATNARSLGTAAKTARTEVKELGNAAETASRKIRTLGREAQTAGRHLNTLGNRAATAARNLDRYGNAARSANSHLNSLGDRSRTAGRDLARMSGQIDTAIRDLTRLAAAARTADSRLNGLGGRGLAGVRRYREEASRLHSTLSSLTGLAALGGVTLGAAEVVKEGKEYQQAMNAFGATTNATRSQMLRAAATANQLGNDLQLPGSTAADAAEAMLELAKAGFRTDQAISASRASLVLASAAQINAADSAKYLGDMMDQFGMGADQAGKAADTLAATANAASGDIIDIYYAMKYAGPVAHGLGVNMQEAAAAVGMLGKAGILGQTAGTTLRGMMANLAAPTPQMIQGLKAMGIEAWDAQGSFKGLRYVIDGLSKAQHRMSQQDFAAAVKKSMGKPAMSGAIALAHQGVESFDAMMQAVSETGAASDIAAAKGKGLAGALLQLKTQAKQTGLTIYQGMAPGLEWLTRGVTQGLAAATPKIESFFKYLNDSADLFGPDISAAARREFSGIADAAKDLAEPFKDLGGEALADFLHVLLSAGQAAIEILVNLGHAVEPVVSALGDLSGESGTVASSLDLVVTVIDLVTSAIGALSGVLVPVGHIVGSLVSAFGALPGPVQQFVLAALLVRRIQGPMSGLASTVSGRVTGAFRSLGEQMRVQQALAATAGQSLSRYGAAMAVLQTRVPIIGRMGESFRTAAAQSTGFAATLRGVTAAAGTGLRGAMSGLMGAMGGPWGVALTGLTVGLGMLASAQQQAAAKAAEHKADIDGLTAAMRQSNGVIDENVRQQAAQTIQNTKLQGTSQSLVGVMGRMGYSLSDLTDSYLGQGESVDQLADKMEALAKEKMKVAVAEHSGRGLLDQRSGEAKAAEKQANAYSAAAKALRGMSGDAKTAAKNAKELDAATKGNGDGVSAYSRLKDAVSALADKTADADSRTRALRDALDLLSGGSVSLQAAQARVHEAITQANEAMAAGINKADGYGKALVNANGTLNTTTKNGQQLFNTFNTIADGASNAALAAFDFAQTQGRSLPESIGAARKEMQDARDSAVKLAEGYGLSAQQAGKVADSLGLIPGQVSILLSTKGVDGTLADLLAVQAEFQKVPNSKTIRVDSLSADAKKDLEDLGYKIQLIPGTREYKITAPTQDARNQLDLLIQKMSATPGGKNITVSAQTLQAIQQIESVQAAIKRTPGAKQVIVKTLNAEAIAALEAVGLKTRQLPDGRTAVYTANGAALGAIGAVERALNNLNGKTVNTYTNNIITTVRRERSEASTLNRPYQGEGNLSKSANGAIWDYYANGGVRSPGRSENHIAQIAPAGTWRVWAEPETMGEGYVPFAPSKRTRSRAITEEIVRRLGGDPAGIQWHANGGIAGGVQHFASGGVADFTYSPTGTMKTTSDVQSAYSDAHQPITKDEYNKKLRARANAVDALRAAEARLQQVRKGKHTHAQLVAAENAVAKARRNLATATEAAKAAEARYKKQFSLSDWGKTLAATVKANKAYEANLAKIAARGGADVIDQLRDMGAEGAAMVAALAKASKKQFQDIVNNLRKLAPLAKATLADYTKQLGTSTSGDATFQVNLAKLASMGYGDLAAQLAAQGDEAAQQIAAQAVKSKSDAAKANQAVKDNQNSVLSQEQLGELIQIIAAIKSSKTGIHDVAKTTGLGEDEIIAVANKSKLRIMQMLGGRAAKFLADLNNANKHLAYAEGGIRAGLYATSGGIIRFAEPETGGEAYLPLSPSKRRTALPVLADVARRFGVGITDAAATRPIVIVKEGGDTHVSVTAVRTGASASDIGAQVGRSVRRARRGGVAARAA